MKLKIPKSSDKINGTAQRQPKDIPTTIMPEKQSFSDFFRNASQEEKEKLFLEVTKKANEDQRKVMQEKPNSFNLGNPETPGYKTTNANTMQEENWREWFDQKFDHINQQPSPYKICDSDCDETYSLEDIKEFCASVERKAVERTVRELFEIAKEEINQSSAEKVPIYVRQMQAIQIYASGHSIDLNR